MKKVALILLICIYAFATMGFSLRHFYCCGILKTISLTVAGNENNKCNKSHNDNDGCCKNKLQYCKVKDAHITTAHISFPAKHFKCLHLNYLSFENITFSSRKTFIVYRSNAPPFYSSIPLYISNCVFRI